MFKRELWTVLVRRGDRWDVQWIGPGQKADAQDAAKKLNDRPANSGDYFGSPWNYKAVPVSEARALGIPEEFLKV